METIDIDKIVRDKLKEANEAHGHEIESSRPFIWAAILRKTGEKRSLNWFHMAAAVVLIVTAFSMALYGIQQNFRREIQRLTGQIDRLKRDYNSRAAVVRKKDNQVEYLSGEVKNLEMKLAGIDQMKNEIPVERVVIRTDTVYMDRIRYIAATPDSTRSPVRKLLAGKPGKTEKSPAGQSIDPDIDNAIFTGYAQPGTNKPARTIRLKFGSFAVNGN